jgi:carboxylesterase type B
VRGWQVSHSLGTEEVIHDLTKLVVKRGVIVGYRLGVRGWRASHALGTEEVIHDMTKVGVKRGK